MQAAGYLGKEDAYKLKEDISGSAWSLNPKIQAEA